MTIVLRRDNPSGLGHLSRDLRERVEAFCANFGDAFLVAGVGGKLGDSARELLGECVDTAAKADRFPTSAQLGNALRACFRGGVAGVGVETVKLALSTEFRRLDDRLLADVAIKVVEGVRRDSAQGIAAGVAVVQTQLAGRLSRQSAHFLLASYLLYRVLKDHEVEDPLSIRAELASSYAPPSVRLWWKISRLYSNLTDQTEIFKEFEWIFASYSLSATPDNPAFLPFLSGLERWCERTAAALGPEAYDFSELEDDAWAEVYQEYLDPAERQRLGGFYTPGPLVEVMLDAAQYFPEHAEARDLVVLDPTCGSGSFLVGCAHRLVKVIRATEHVPRRIVDQYASRLVGNDIHRFATFLTGVNLLFPVIGELAALRQESPQARIPLRIYAEDFLRVGGGARGLAALGGEVTLIVGNPPWGGVLKGWQGPLYDAAGRLELRTAFGPLWRDKVDVYALFLSKVLDFLPPGGRLAFLIQSSLLDKDFGEPLRAKLTGETTPTALIDLSGQGGSYFNTAQGGIVAGTARKKAMNVPFGLVVKKTVEIEGTIRCVTTRYSLSTREERSGELARLTAAVRDQIAGHEVFEETFGRRVKLSAYDIEISLWRAWAGDVWRLDPALLARAVFAKLGGEPLLDVVTTAQGATALGDVVFEAAGRSLSDQGFAGPGFYPALRGNEVARGIRHGSTKRALYPYSRDGQRLFVGEAGDLLDPTSVPEEATVLGEDPPLDRLLEYRIANRNISPDLATVARSLVPVYSPLSGRRPKNKPMQAFGRQWYEWLWPRQPDMMLGIPKIIAQRITTRPNTGIDVEGHMPYHTVIVIVPNRPRFNIWLAEWGARLGLELEEMDGLAIIAAWLNSAPVRGLHTIGRVPRPGEVRELTSDLAAEIRAPAANATAYRAELEAFVRWAVAWRTRPRVSCLDPLGTDVDDHLRRLGGWDEPTYQ